MDIQKCYKTRGKTPYTDKLVLKAISDQLKFVYTFLSSS